MSSSYRTACVTLIDILGFKHMVDDIYRDEPSTIANILELFVSEQSVPDQQSPTGALVSHSPTAVLSFSDTVIRIADMPKSFRGLPHTRVVKVPDDTGEAATTIAHEILSLRRIQRKLATNSFGFEKPGFPGLMIRGGLTVGEISNDHIGSHVFGPALNRAATLEQSAVHPMIAIDPDCLKNYSTMFSELVKSGAVASASSDNCYIDYFTPESHWSGFNHDFDYGFNRGAAREQLTRMAEMLRQRLNTHIGNEDVRSKYLWAKERHNDAVFKSATAFSLAQDEIDALLVD
ncbi:MAG: hypothetical protein LBR39_05690 [Coriobacteriales bacterium]|jgi:hypothetical protein|nr:hypothetical protein [Coriobacteriales bacterium]